MKNNQQSYIVYPEGDKFHIQGRINGSSELGFSWADEAIQAAVDMLADGGGTVILERGLYDVRGTIRLSNNIWLCGSGRGTELRLNAECGDEAVLMGEHLHGAVISDLTVSGWDHPDGGTGIIFDDCGDCVVHDVFCIGFADYGIWMRNHSFLCEIRGCRLTDNAKANLYLAQLGEGGRGGDFVPNLVSNCIIYGGGKGIDCNQVIVLNIVGCQVFQTNGIGYHIRNSSNSVLISASRSFQVEKDAVVVESSHEINISSNIFCWHRGHGIILRQVKWGSINSNNVIDTGTRNLTTMTGIILEDETKGVQITGNAVFNWGDQPPMKHGITETADCASNNIVSNNINYCTDEAIVCEGDGTVQANNVCVTKEVHLSGDKPPYPDFDMKRMETFISGMKRG